MLENNFIRNTFRFARENIRYSGLFQLRYRTVIEEDLSPQTQNGQSMCCRQICDKTL